MHLGNLDDSDYNTALGHSIKDNCDTLPRKPLLIATVL